MCKLLTATTELPRICDTPQGVTGEIYNIGTDAERTVLDVARAVASHFNIPEEKIVHVKDRAFNDRWATGKTMRCCLWPFNCVHVREASSTDSPTFVLAASVDVLQCLERLQFRMQDLV